MQFRQSRLSRSIEISELNKICAFIKSISVPNSETFSASHEKMKHKIIQQRHLIKTMFSITVFYSILDLFYKPPS